LHFLAAIDVTYFRMRVRRWGASMRFTLLTIWRAAFRATLAACLMVAVLVGAAVAGPYEDAEAALQRGDKAIARQIIQSLAEQGDARAQFDLGSIISPFAQGDWAEALKWWRKAADQGYAPAQYAIGFLYCQAWGVPQDYVEALKWFRKAAEQGYASGLHGLGTLYSAGDGVPQNYVLAYMWFNLAASANREPGKPYQDFRNQIAAEMTSAQIAEGQRMSERCLRSNYADCGLPQVARREDKAAPPTTRRNEVASTGTGFFVSETGHIVTNAHVVEGCQTVRSSLGGALRKVSVDEESDLALYVASEKPDGIARLRGGRGARAGESVVVSTDPIVTTGIISALSGLRNDRRTIQITAPVQPGNSGGPLLGENGSIVGVVVGKLNAVKVAEATGDIPQNVNFAVSLGTLQTFLNTNSVPYALDDSCFLGRFLCSKATKTPADITTEATRYTVLLECLR
jgi:hypothetical protein